MRYFSFCVVFCLFVFTVKVDGQRICGTLQYLQRQVSVDATHAAQTQPDVLTAATRDTLNNELINIPVVVHVLYNNSSQNISDTQVKSQIDVLNKDYRRLNDDKTNTPLVFATVAADVRINFCIARIDESGKATTGIIHKYTAQTFFNADDQMKFSSSGGDNAWNSKKYLNIWVCYMGGRLLGYSSLPGSEAAKDGVVIQPDAFGTTGTATYPFNKGRTATHEIGHWLGLKHIWGDADCGDDGIGDTPPQKTYNNGCPNFPHISTCSINGNGDMFMNFMEFTDDGCMNLFTQGQKMKMRSYFAAGGLRNSFLNSNVCDSAQALGGPLPADSNVVTTAVKLYPNPAVNIITIESNKSNELTGKILRIFNTFGRVVLVTTLQSQKSVIDVSHFNAGIFIIKIEGGVTIKFMKQ